MERLPGLLSIIARGTDGAAVSLSLDAGDRDLGRVGVYHRFDRGQPRPPGDGLPEDEARGALRLSLGRTTTDEDVETAFEVVPRVIASMQVGSASVARDPLGQGVAA